LGSNFLPTTEPASQYLHGILAVLVRYNQQPNPINCYEILYCVVINNAEDVQYYGGGDEQDKLPKQV